MSLFPKAALLLAGATLATSCQTIIHPRAIEAPDLAVSKAAADFGSYRISRVGLLPVSGTALSPEEAVELQEIFYSEFSERARFELVLLDLADLAEVTTSEPYLRGVYRPETVLDISRRFGLDGLLVASVSHRQEFPPQKLNMHLDLVAAETGMTIWTSTVALQADRPDVVKGLEAFFGNGLPMSDDSWATALLSPSQFARFGVWQMARAL